jgi:hypothetical protein
MKGPHTRIVALILICLAAHLRPVQAQTARVAATASAPFRYDIGSEVTLAGTVSSVLLKAAPGMIPGSHLLLQSPAGSVDISLGTFGMQGKGALSVQTGQRIEVTGVMKAFKGAQIFLARTVTVGNEVYAIRNEHGIPVSPKARERASQKNTRNGDTL